MAKAYPDQTRNLNPTPEAVVAMSLWGKAYSEQRGGSMQFWEKLSDSNKRVAREIAQKVCEANERHKHF